MSDSKPVLSVRNVGRRTDRDQWLIRGVCFDLYPGECRAVVGPSGSGKSVLLRAIAGLDSIDEGEIRFHDKPMAAYAMPSYRARVMYLHQRPSLFEGTVEDNLRRVFRLRVHRGKAYDRNWHLEVLTGLGRDPASFLSRRVSALSGGEQQLVSLLRALQLEPDLLLLDEPTASLDPDGTRVVERLIETWRRKNPSRALLWVTHDADQSHRVADRRIRMRNGSGVEP